MSHNLDDLVSLDIFDSEEANYYLTKESIATYMPQQLPCLQNWQKFAQE